MRRETIEPTPAFLRAADEWLRESTASPEAADAALRALGIHGRSMMAFTKQNTPQHKRMAMGEKVTGYKSGGAVPAKKAAAPMKRKGAAGKGKC